MKVKAPLSRWFKVNTSPGGGRRAVVFVLAAALSVLSLPAVAAERPDNGIFSLVFENDIFSNTDQYYTNGIRLAWLSAPERTPDWALRTAHRFTLFSNGERVRISYALGQDIYTPKDIGAQNPPLDDRPYAGWLYGSVGLASETGLRLDQLQLTIGVIGPASGAEQTQRLVHDLLHTTEVNGWETQLKNEPGFILTYRRYWRSWITESMFGIPFDITPHAGGALGNVFTYANAGLMLRYGRNLPLDYGPPGILPGMPGAGFFVAQHGFNWYLFTGIDGRVVARNIFLDGNTFRDSRSVAKKPLVGDLQFGVAITWGRIRLGYTHVLRTREFKSQEGRLEGFGAISLSIQN